MGYLTGASASLLLLVIAGNRQGSGKLHECSSSVLPPVVIQLCVFEYDSLLKQHTHREH